MHGKLIVISTLKLYPLPRVRKGRKEKKKGNSRRSKEEVVQKQKHHEPKKAE